MPVVVLSESRHLNSMTHLLNESELKELPSILPGWQVQDGKIKRTWRFNNFSEAFAFMVRVAMAAEQLGHHPDWSNSWNKVSIELVCHDLGGISDLDVNLAKQINQICP